VLAWLGLALLGLPAAAVAQAGAGAVAKPGQSDPSKRRKQVPGLEKVDVEEHLDEKVPLDVTFKDHTGQTVKLREFFDDDRPVLLTLNYYTCPTLCSMILESTAKTMKNVPWTAGKEYEIVTISIDPRDTPKRAKKKRKEMLRKYGKSDEGWHFLVGQEKNIKKVADAAGFEYFYNAAQEQYAHPAVVMFLTPDARFARYLYGLQYKAADARLALFEAAKGNTLSAAEKVVLYCYAYDPDESSYVLLGWRVMQVGGSLSAVVLITLLVLLWRWEFKKKRRKSQDDEGAPDSSPAGTHPQVETP
jgi:protein SCO1/2